MFTGSDAKPLQAKSENMLPDSTEPCIAIIEQPKARGFRFRYSCEGPSHGGIPGESSDRNRRNYPSVQILNYVGYARIVVQLVTNEENPRLHPHSLVGKQCQNGICTVQCGPKDMTATFPNLGIQHVTKKNVAKILEERYLAAELQLSSVNEGYSEVIQNAIKDEDKKRIQAKAQAEAKSIDLSVVRLMFIAYLPDSDGAFTIMLKPEISNAIFDSKAPNAATLKICRMDKTHGNARGRDEVYLLCDKVQKDDIQVRFFEEDANGDEVWEAYGNFSPSDVHRQFAIVFTTPQYKDVNIRHNVTVQVQLRRRSDGETSDPKKFTYTPVTEDAEGLDLKRRKINSYFPDHSSGGGDSQPKNSGGFQFSNSTVTGNFNFQSNGNGSPNGGKQAKNASSYAPKVPQIFPIDPGMLAKRNNILQPKNEPNTMGSFPLYPASSPQHNPISPTSNTNYGNLPKNVFVPQVKPETHVPTLCFPGTQIPMPKKISTLQPKQLMTVSTNQPFVNLQSQKYIEKSPLLSTGSATPDSVYSPYSSGVPSVGVQSVVESTDTLTADDTDQLIDELLQNSPELAEQIYNDTSGSGGLDFENDNMLMPSCNIGIGNIFGADFHERFSYGDIQIDASGEVHSSDDEEDSEDEGFGGALITDKAKKNKISKPEVNKDKKEDEIVGDLASEISQIKIQTQIATKIIVDEVNTKHDKQTTETESVPENGQENETGNSEIVANKTDDMKIDEDMQYLASLDKAHLTKLIMQITENTTNALQDYALTGDVKWLLTVTRYLTTARNDQGDMLLHTSLENDQNHVFDSLLQVILTIPERMEMINALNSDQQTPLHIAISRNNNYAARKLLEVGANPEIADVDGNSSAHLACEEGNVGILIDILRYADINIISLCNVDGMTPLHLSCKAEIGARQCIKFLLKKKVDVNIQDSKSGRTPLHIAVERKNLVIVGFLIADCYADIEARTFDGYTPLHLAASSNAIDAARLLLACGANVNAESMAPLDSDSTEIDEDDYGCLPVHLAASHEMIKLLTTETETDDESVEDYNYNSIDDIDPIQRHHLCCLLDKPETGKDWVELASALCLTPTITSIKEQQKSPTDCLLDNYSFVKGNIDGLRSALASIGREDAVKILNNSDFHEEISVAPKSGDDNDERLESGFGSMTLSTENAA